MRKTRVRSYFVNILNVVLFSITENNIFKCIKQGFVEKVLNKHYLFYFITDCCIFRIIGIDWQGGLNIFISFR